MDWSVYHLIAFIIGVIMCIKINTIMANSKRKYAVILSQLCFIFVIAIMSRTPERGWATSEDVPDEFIYVYGIVEKPKNSPGKIYIWIREKCKPSSSSSCMKPRSYEVTYTDDLANIIQNANAKVAVDGEFDIMDSSVPTPQNRNALNDI